MNTPSIQEARRIISVRFEIAKRSGDTNQARQLLKAWRILRRIDNG